MANITDILKDIETLSLKEQETLKLILSYSKANALGLEELLTDERFANGRVCPHCGCICIVRNGKRKDGKQRYICKDCQKSFVITSNSIVAGTKKDIKTWETYIDCMMYGLSVRKSADICKIHKNTAFVWRHKILDALQNIAQSVSLNGIIEADETFFPVSFKGNWKHSTFAMSRKAHN